LNKNLEFLKLQTEFDHEILDANFQEFAVLSKIFHDAGNSKFLFNFFIDSRM
jgi:hypothetical protein